MFINYATGEIIFKIVYYGMGLCGKTTNLRAIHDASTPETKTKLLSLATLSDRTLFFDLLPIEVGTLAGMRLRLQLYTVPGQVFYNETRQAVLKGVDGVVLVVDSQRALLPGNIDSLKNLKENLKELGIPWDDLPLVVQYNKRDLRDIVPTEELDRHFAIAGAPSVHACASKGMGVSETLRAITRQVLKKMPLALDEEHRTGEAVLDRMPETEPAPDVEAEAADLAEAQRSSDSGSLSGWSDAEAIESSDPLGLDDPSTSEIEPVEVSQIADGTLPQTIAADDAKPPKAGELNELITALQGSGWLQDESTPQASWPRGRDGAVAAGPTIVEDVDDLLLNSAALTTVPHPQDSGPIVDPDLDSAPVRDSDRFLDDSGPIVDPDLFGIDSDPIEDPELQSDDAATVVLTEEDEAARDAILAEHLRAAAETAPNTEAAAPRRGPAPPKNVQSDALRGFVARLEEVSPPRVVQADQSSISTDSLLQEIARKAAELARSSPPKRAQPPAAPEWIESRSAVPPKAPPPAAAAEPPPPPTPEPPKVVRRAPAHRAPTPPPPAPDPAPTPEPPKAAPRPAPHRVPTPPPAPPAPAAAPEAPRRPQIQSRVTTLRLPESEAAEGSPSGAEAALRLEFEGPIYCDSRFAVEALATLPEEIDAGDVNLGLLCDPERIGLITHPMAPLASRGGRTRFPLVAVTEGWHRLQSFLLWNGTFVARAGCELFVFGRHHVGQPYVTATEPKSSPIDLRFPIHAHDLVVGLFTDRVGDEYRLSYFVYQRQTDTVMVPRPLTLPASPTTICRKALHGITAAEPLRREGQMVSAGISLWSMLIPPELEMLFSTSGEAIDSILIASEDTWIPWEILRSGPEELPLGATYRFGQWPGTLAPRGSIARGATVSVLGDKEDGALVPVGNVALCRTRESALVTLTGRRTDLIYARGVSESDPDLPAFSALSMSDGSFQVADLQGFATEIHEARPWIFLDPLATDDESTADSGASAWASLTCGRLMAGGLVAPRLALTREGSREAWRRLDQHLLGGMTIGAALREVRRYAQSDPDADATLMTFALFGDPEARLEG
ncbi:MAG: GTPase domain-containing protein [Acidobacteriota bacterium]